jgi:hypothetical protein
MGAKAQIEEMRNGVGRQRATLKSDYNNIDTQFKEQLIKTKVRSAAVILLAIARSSDKSRRQAEIDRSGSLPITISTSTARHWTSTLSRTGLYEDVG